MMLRRGGVLGRGGSRKMTRRRIKMLLRRGGAGGCVSPIASLARCTHRKFEGSQWLARSPQPAN
eukprot:7635337-Pyramimonas_sp.AAC.1